MESASTTSVGVTTSIKHPTKRKLPPQLLLFQLAYRLEIIRYWCTVCLDPPRGLDVSNSNIVMAVMEFEVMLTSFSGVGRTECRQRLQANAFRRPLDTPCEHDGPKSSQSRSLAESVLQEFCRVEAELDRTLSGQAGWDWYCLGRAIGAFRIELYQHHRRVGSKLPVPQPRGIARAALAIPASEAEKIRSIHHLNTVDEFWTLDQMVNIDEQVNALGIRASELDPQWVIELWQARLNRELLDAFSESPSSTAAHNQQVFGFLGLNFDDARMIAYREVNGEEVQVQLRSDRRLWVFLKELSRASGKPLTKEEFGKTRLVNGYTDDIEDDTYRKDKYRLTSLLKPLGLTIKAVPKLAYVLVDVTNGNGDE